jgi:diguanylate cyclase (GGDEF)-like protein
VDAGGEEKLRVALAGMWEQFRGSLSDQVSVLEDAAVAALSGDLAPEPRDRARSEAHKLAGSLGTFGLARGSDIAREVESWFASGVGADPVEILRLSDLVVALRGCFDAGPTSGLIAAPGPTDIEAPAPFLLLVDEDPVMVDELRREALLRGLDLLAVDGADSARELLAARRPEAVLLDLAGSGAQDAFELMRELRARLPPVPVVVLTSADTFTDRVEAARLGGRGFLRKPIAPADVLLAVGEVIDRARAGEVTVLAVDDDRPILAALSALLTSEGRRVVTLDEPLQFWETLKETSPDLVVLDVDMPQVSGVEMCQVMRADPQWSRLPVVFLTGSTDAASVESIFAAGADDYVSKPLVGPELTTRIANRLERSRLLRRMAEIDPLTGVANRRTSGDAMERLLAMGERLGQPVVAAMVDVDGVRSLNDRFGYGAGDEVLAGVGDLLLRSFAGDEVVGRWAGPEFLVGMFGMTRADGVQRLAEVLEELRSLRFSEDRGESFGATFTAGVAQYPDDGVDLRSLYRAADSALRRAKEGGGDRVVPVGLSIDADSMIDVVLVEDDEALAGILLHGLATRAYRTQRFDDGQEAATALQGPTPTVVARVVVLDWGLPGLDGLRVLRNLAETGVLGRTRVIMLTARDSENEVLQALDLGAFDHVAKPFSVPVLMKRVHRAMEW